MRRRGFQLVEVLLALAIAGGPMLVTLQLVRSAVRQAAVAKEHATTRLQLMDFLTVLAGEPVEGLRDLAAGGPSALEGILLARIARMPSKWQVSYREQVSMLKGRLTCHLTEDVEGVKGLGRLTLTGKLSDGNQVLVFRLLRPSPRDALKTGEAFE